MITAALFDLDDTLFDHRGCAREALAAVHQAHGPFRTIPFERLAAAHAQFLEELHGEVMLGRVPIETARVERFRRLLAAAGAEADGGAATRLAAIYRDTYRTVRRATAGAEPLLAAIASRVRIGVVSNNLLEEQQDKLQTCGLDRFVDVLVVSEEAGVSKPDPAIFIMALERLQVTAGDAVMVGDSWEADIAGARAAGIRAIWFNPLALPRPAADDPVPELRSLEPAADVMRMILDANRD